MSTTSEYKQGSQKKSQSEPHGDPLVERIRAAAPSISGAPAEFKKDLRQQLARQARSGRPVHSKILGQLTSSLLRWTAAGAALAALVMILVWTQTLIVPSPGEPGGQGQPAAVLSTQTAVLEAVQTAPPVGSESTQPTTSVPAAPAPSAAETPALAPPGAAAQPEEWVLGIQANPHQVKGLSGPRTGSSGNVYLSTLQGDQTALLAGGDAPFTHLIAFSPDGKMALLYSYVEAFIPPDQTGVVILEPEHTRLYIQPLDGGERIVLSNTFLARASHPYTSAFWTADSQSIIFTDRDSLGWGVFQIGADGRGLVRLSPIGVEPLWLLPAVVDEGVYWQLGSWNSPEDSLREGPVGEYGSFFWSALDGSGKTFEAAWIGSVYGSGRVSASIDSHGERIALLDRSCDPWVYDNKCRSVDIYSRFIPELEPAPLRFPGTPVQTVWSPDGSRLLVEVWQAGEGEGSLGRVYYLWDGQTDPVRLPEALETWWKNYSAIEDPPQWSPDGSQILFVNSFDGPEFSAAIYDLDTGGVRRVLRDMEVIMGAGISRIRWLPEGR